MPSIRWDRCLGAIETLPPSAVPDGYAVSAVNVDLSPHQLMKPRAGLTTLTASVTGEVYNLFSERIAGTEVLWRFADFLGTPNARRGATSITLTDTPAASGESDAVTCCAHNGKVFIAYNSAENRLHVWDGNQTSSPTTVRRVGLVKSAAATVANTGAGAYAATLRYYKVQFLIHTDSDLTRPIMAASELSDAVSFTPSGAGTAARVTKPTTVDSATHWRVFGSTDGVTYYHISGHQAVGTTTWDDALTPSQYYLAYGETAPEVGLHVPPPSARFLATNGERLFMAGAHETSASAGQTTPGTRRVWFTRPIGATADATYSRGFGDDESVTQTVASRYYVDIENEDGSPITGLVSAIDGSIYVGTATSVWRLTDTGDVTRPIRAERVVAGVGPSSHYLMTVSDAVDGGMLYFGRNYDGPYRYSPATGLQYVGADWVNRHAPTTSLKQFYMHCCAWDAQTRRVAWVYASSDAAVTGNVRWLDPALVSQIDGVWRGGWSLDSYEIPDMRLRCAAYYNDALVFGGQDGTPSALLCYRAETLSQDDSNDYTATLTSKSWMPAGGRNLRTEEPFIWKRRNLSVSMAMTRNRGGTGNSVSDTAASESIAGGETAWHRIKVEGLVLADAASVELELGVTTPVVTSTARHLDGVDAVEIPFVPMENG